MIEKIRKWIIPTLSIISLIGVTLTVITYISIIISATYPNNDIITITRMCSVIFVLLSVIILRIIFRKNIEILKYYILITFSYALSCSIGASVGFEKYDILEWCVLTLNYVFSIIPIFELRWRLKRNNVNSKPFLSSKIILITIGIVLLAQVIQIYLTYGIANTFITIVEIVIFLMLLLCVIAILKQPIQKIFAIVYYLFSATYRSIINWIFYDIYDKDLYYYSVDGFFLFDDLSIYQMPYIVLSALLYLACFKLKQSN